MKYLKKFSVFAVLFIFLANTMGYFVVFKCNQFLIQQEMITQIRCGTFQGKIVLLKIVDVDKEINFHRIEKKEFTYFGKLYDLVIEHKNGDTTFFYCLRDKKEEVLLADYTLYLYRNGGSSSTHKPNPVLALLYNLVNQALIQTSTVPILGQGITFHFPISETHIIPVYLVHFAPPPELS